MRPIESRASLSSPAERYRVTIDPETIDPEGRARFADRLDLLRGLDARRVHARRRARVKRWAILSAWLVFWAFSAYGCGASIGWALSSLGFGG